MNNSTDTLTADVVIVGAGSAGCVLAERLSADPTCQVLLVEAGSSKRPLESRLPAAFAKLFGTEADWAYVTEPQAGLEHRRLRWPRGRLLGGSGAINAQMWIEPDPQDLADWRHTAPTAFAPERVAAAAHALADRMAPESLRDPSPLTSCFVHAGASLGLRSTTDPNDHLRGDRIAPTPVSQRGGRRLSPRDAYLDPARRRPNLRVVTDALVQRVVVVDGRATGVELLVNGRVQHVRAARGVVVAAGSVGSPHLLQRSGIGAADDLRRAGVPVHVELPAVGRHLRDHLMSIVVARTDGRVPTLRDAERPRQLLAFLLRRRGMLTSNVAEATALLRSAPDVEAPDLQFIFTPVMFLDHGQTAPPAHGVSIGVVLLRPESEGRVTLRTGRAHDAPHIDPAYLSDAGDRDLDRLVTGVERALALLRTGPLSGHVDGMHEPTGTSRRELESFVRSRAETVYHPTGTCRMGSDPATSVVDASFAVHGVRGLWVVDASVLPSIPRGNTAAPTMLLAELAAAQLAAGDQASPWRTANAVASLRLRTPALP